MALLSARLLLPFSSGLIDPPDSLILTHASFSPQVSRLGDRPHLPRRRHALCRQLQPPCALRKFESSFANLALQTEQDIPPLHLADFLNLDL